MKLPMYAANIHFHRSIHLQYTSNNTCFMQVLWQAGLCMNDHDVEPKLAPPGAGLPKVELFIARLLFARGRRKGNRAAFDARFQQERGLVRSLVRDCDDAAASRRVLIRRIPGLEDSSRYWSVWMTLEHLRVIHGVMTRTIEALGRGVEPAGKIDTASVKPSAAVTGAVVDEYEKSCDTLLATAAAIPDLRTTVKFAHPWFGPLDAAGWHALASIHLGLHRQQIERIVAGV